MFYSIDLINDFKTLKENVLAKKIENKVLSIPYIDDFKTLKGNVLAKKVKKVFAKRKKKVL